MKLNRRELLTSASLGAASLAAGLPAGALRSRGGEEMTDAKDTSQAYKYRIAFGAWINDMRQDPLPLQNWPAPQLDDETIDSAIKAMDVQSRAGFNLLDVWGLFATYGWPPDIKSVLDKDRRRRIQRLLKAAQERGIGLVYGMGVYSWGYDKIMEADPSVRGKQYPGNIPHPHAMCDANPKSFGYVKQILDFVLSEFDFAGVHMESCDQGCCFCPQCAGKDGVVGYNTRINAKTADYIKSKWPNKIVYSITINWVPPGKHFNETEKGHVAELSRHINCLFDQGHNGYMVDPAQRQEFIQNLHCDYGTSGGLWLYPDVRWDRASYFLPYVKRNGSVIKRQHGEGVRGCLFYQGPVNNPGTEVNIAAGGRLLANTDRNVDDVLADVLETLYKPRNEATHKKLIGLFQRAEESYFSQWSEKRFHDIWGIPVPGEFKLDQNLFGVSPGPATFLREPCLDAAGRLEYKQALKSILADLPEIEAGCADNGRLKRIKQSAMITLNLLNTTANCQGETKVWHDW